MVESSVHARRLALEAHSASDGDAAAQVGPAPVGTNEVEVEGGASELLPEVSASASVDIDAEMADARVESVTGVGVSAVPPAAIEVGEQDEDGVPNSVMISTIDVAVRSQADTSA